MNQVDTTKLRVPTEALGSYTVGLHYYIDWRKFQRSSQYTIIIQIRYDHCNIIY